LESLGPDVSTDALLQGPAPRRSRLRRGARDRGQGPEPQADAPTISRQFNLLSDAARAAAAPFLTANHGEAA
jgi:hypothetical protein